MSFNNELKKVRDDSASLGMRYVSLRHCVELYSPFGFDKTWKFMEQRFGLKDSAENGSNVFTKCADFLDTDRNNWKALTKAQGQMAKTRTKYGLPKPKFTCDNKY